MDASAFIAFNRFGLGRRPEEAIPADPRAWLRAQLTAADSTPSNGLPTTEAALAVMVRQGMEDQARRVAQGPADPAPTAAKQAAPVQVDANTGDMRLRPVGDLARQEVHALLARALMTDAPFRERLVWFWANHFTVANRDAVVTACSGAYVREAIRPHVTGRFSTLLLAVMRHPAMLHYLNQSASAGPDSLAGQRRHLGLNENLARESLELHTVTPASGYTQADVTTYARILTGWSVEARVPPVGFRFRPNLHQPGEMTVMGRTWPSGEAGGEAILDWLGTHPATYRHLAEKLVRHFVADDPPEQQVVRIEAVLRDTGGDLGAASAALVDLPGAWVPMTKLRSPQEFVVGCLRALGMTPDMVPNMGGMVAGLGQPVFQAPFPIGWPDRAVDWASPEAMLQRVDYASGLAGRMEALDPAQMAHDTLGPLLSKHTLSQIQAAGSRQDALTLLLASPEFQRR